MVAPEEDLRRVIAVGNQLFLCSRFAVFVNDSCDLPAYAPSTGRSCDTTKAVKKALQTRSLIGIDTEPLPRFEDWGRIFTSSCS